MGSNPVHKPNKVTLSAMASDIALEYEVIGEFTEDSQYLWLPFWKAYQRTFKRFIGKELLITIKELKSKRSDKQNRFFWSVIIPYVRQWLYDTQGIKYQPDHVSVWLRTEILGEAPTIIDVAGRECIVMTSKRFSAMNTKEFAEAVDTIRSEMLLRGLDIPEPTTDKSKHNLPHEFLNDD